MSTGPQGRRGSARGGWSRPALWAALAGATVVGLGLGFWAKGGLPQRPRDLAETARSGPDQLVQIEVMKPTFSPVPQALDRLEVLPADVKLPQAPSEAAPEPIQTNNAPPVASVTRQASEPPAALPQRTMGTPAPSGGRRQPERASDCLSAPSRADRMLCDDAELAGWDHELSAAYSRALRAGAPPQILREEHEDWLAIREDAAHYSRRALVSVYDQRIGELNALAEDPG